MDFATDNGTCCARGGGTGRLSGMTTEPEDADDESYIFEPATPGRIPDADHHALEPDEDSEDLIDDLHEDLE
ncbi:MAG: hypothetical protein JWM76_2298 [Pseudonocardiales bacterium]|nr:hypothetical protein [Pseudonocardiales bacterium]